ncbi:uncharacterized protein LOC122349330 [Puntigrus tetrazona]|uniref:uncharacterized protein LOC122349330 n=1 Tax=Puntigrus tetrazona TaxID=1606681 RepID=UPI001C8A644E|nr:uncharacterized protein LOC122349330 [Puntigrus tetrazona]
MSLIMVPPLSLVFLLIIPEVYGLESWSVRYSSSHICALKHSSVIMRCTYTYPPEHQIKKVFWTKTKNKNPDEEFPDLSEDPEYSQRFQYLGDKEKSCTMRLSHVTQKDEHEYCFRFTTDEDKWIGHPGVTLTVLDLQVESPERVTEGDSVRLTCKSSCALTDRATFIWYRNSQPLTERRDRNNILLLQSVRREDAGRYSCALQEHTYISPEVYLNVTCEYVLQSFLPLRIKAHLLDLDRVSVHYRVDASTVRLTINTDLRDQMLFLSQDMSSNVTERDVHVSESAFWMMHHMPAFHSENTEETSPRHPGGPVCNSPTSQNQTDEESGGEGKPVRKHQDSPAGCCREIMYYLCEYKINIGIVQPTDLLKTCVYVLMSVRMSLPLALAFLLMIYGVYGQCDWGLSYGSSRICALVGSTVTIYCNYTYPPEHQIREANWTKTNECYQDLLTDPEYSQRFKYLGDKEKNCTMRLSHVTQKDEDKYYFRFITDQEKWLGLPGVTLTVTDLQVESPERVTEGDSVRLTCKSSCALTDRATFIWYRNSQPLTERRDRNNILLLQSVRREDAGRYSCALQEHTYISPEVYLNVTYPPRNVSVFINESGEIVEGDSVTLICSSDSNPPAEISWFKGRTLVRSGRIYSISKIRSDHSGEYKCRSRNKHGKKYSEAVTLNVIYAPRNVSVFMNGSGEIVEGDSVTLICSTDSNPPALNFFWFKENQSSSVGSGQSFSALQSGRFYCEAHNQHGSLRSDTATVTVHRSDGRTVFQVTLVSGVLFIIVLLFIILRKMMKRRTAIHEYENDDLSLNRYTTLDPRSRSSDQYMTLTTTHPPTAAQQSSSS